MAPGPTCWLFADVGRNPWLLLIPLAPASTTGPLMLARSDLLFLLFADLFGPTFATYRMNATDDAHMSRVVMAWSITNKVVQPIFIAAYGLLAAVTSAKTALITHVIIRFTATAFLPWHRDTAQAENANTLS
jgi:hypothetical protein